ncbi:MAG: cell division protein ZipA [Moraxellaceae bacterium]|nr:cell division protein ZipA [Moraxellaceae bacterium]
MSQPVIVILVITVIAVALYFFVWRPRAQRLRLKIERIPSKRLDDTPEPTEIIGSVRVKPRQEPRLDSNVDEQSAPVIDPVIEPYVEPVIEEVKSEPAKPLEQVDMFPDEPLPEAVEKVYYIHVMSNHSGFTGSELLRCMLQYGLRFGEMDIFHRHESPSGRGEILFSMAQAVEPGTFDIDEMDRSLIAGVTFFMSLPGYKSLIAFDLLVDTARRLANELDGELLDSSTQVISVEQLELWRQEVVKLERHV